MDLFQALPSLNPRYLRKESEKKRKRHGQKVELTDSVCPVKECTKLPSEAFHTHILQSATEKRIMLSNMTSHNSRDKYRIHLSHNEKGHKKLEVC